MRALDEVQAAMTQVIDHGPGFMPQGLFSGTQARALLGLKVHANTISHARLVALEDTFARTRGRLGHERFNALCRDYIELPSARALPLNHIGAGFPAYLAGRDHCDEADLARFEWLWLESYHAPEAPPLRLAELAGIEPDALLEQVVMAHPAARAGLFEGLVHDDLAADVPALAQAEAVLIARPDAEVLVHPASRAMCALLGAASEAIAVGNLLALPDEPESMDQPSPEAGMQALVALLEAGALRKAD